jgi:hypothetical protein
MGRTPIWRHSIWGSRITARTTNITAAVALPALPYIAGRECAQCAEWRAGIAAGVPWNRRLTTEVPMSDATEMRKRMSALRRRGYEVNRVGANRWRITRPGCVGAVHIGGHPSDWQDSSKLEARLRRAFGARRAIADKRRRALIFAHRREIVLQTAAKIRAIGAVPGIILAGERPNPLARVQVATIQTLSARLAFNRIELPEADLVGVDECHHTPARSYRALLARYPNAVILGTTATPCRGNGKGSALITTSSWNAPASPI